MAVERESAYLWSTTALTNGSADTGINWAENQLPSTVNNAARGMMAALARFVKDTNGSITTGGSANAYTLTINGTQTAYATGQIYCFKASFANTGTATLTITNADSTSLGAKSIRRISASGVVVLAGGEIQTDGHFLLQYDSALAGGAGAFLLINPTEITNSTGSATDNAAARFDAATGLIIQNSALIVDDTTGRLSRSGNGGIPVQGTNTNDSAASGDKGEYVSASVASGSAVSLSNNTAKTVTSISLTAGDWDVNGIVGYTQSGATITELDADISTTNNTYDATAGRFTNFVLQSGNIGASTLQVSNVRISISSTTTVYLIAFASFSAGTVSGYGSIWARRVR